METAIAETETALGNFVSVAETQRQTALLEDLRVRHAVLLQEWEELATALDEAVS